MTLRDGRADLYSDLILALQAPLASQTMRQLLEQARDAVLQCPHVDCAYCWQVERKEEG